MSTDRSGPPPPPLPADVVAALDAGKPIEAIKRLRAARGLDLKQAKEAVDAFQRRPRPRAHDGLAPGEMPRRSAGGWLIAILLLLLIAMLARRWLAGPG